MSGVSPRETIHHYERALLDEVRAYAWDWLPETVYFGGGTPSLMAPELLGELMGSIPNGRLREVTLECAPGTLDTSRIVQWSRGGVNRVSLGVQSFVAAELRQTGRRHTAETVRRDVELLRQAGIENINLDLIAGLPEQNADSWEHSLDWIESLAPPHVSVYIFETDEDSRLGKEMLLGGRRYGAQAMPSDDLVTDLYKRAVDRLAAMGIARYEISNFARNGRESRHNLKYWRREPYIGFGLDAHSFDGTYRWSNPDSIETYLMRSPSNERVASDACEEHFFVGLRLMAGIEPSAAEWSRFAEPIERHLRSGMLQRDGGRLRLSGAGVLVSNEIFQDFINV